MRSRHLHIACDLQIKCVTRSSRKSNGDRHLEGTKQVDIKSLAIRLNITVTIVILVVVIVVVVLAKKRNKFPTSYGLPAGFLVPSSPGTIFNSR